MYQLRAAAVVVKGRELLRTPGRQGGLDSRCTCMAVTIPRPADPLELQRLESDLVRGESMRLP